MEKKMKIGTTVDYYEIRTLSGELKGDPVTYTTSSVPFVADSGQTVIQLKGKRGFVNFSHIVRKTQKAVCVICDDLTDNLEERYLGSMGPYCDPCFLKAEECLRDLESVNNFSNFIPVTSDIKEE
jgi:hypothetical protein